MHEKKTKGDIGVAWAIAFTTSQNWNVSLPISEHQKYDFIAEKDGKCKRVQVRYTTPKNGKMEIKLRSIWSDKNGAHYVIRQYEDFDVLAVFNPEDRNVYFIDANKFDNNTSIVLRITESKNSQKSGIRMARDYLNFPD